jgi:hypothetical protein
MTYPAVAIATAFVLAVSACGSTASNGTAAAGPTRATDFESAFTCDELADRWQNLQQGYLDQLGDASNTELDEGSARVDAAAGFIAQAMQEQARDVGLAGCTEELADGGSLLCSRVDRLVTAGAGAADLVEALAAECPAR